MALQEQNESSLLDVHRSFSTTAFLNRDAFQKLCSELFTNILKCFETTKQVDEIFDVFDKNEDGLVSGAEYEYFWHSWLSSVLYPKSAFLIIDVQNDFISGSLALKHCTAAQDGHEVIEPINQLLRNVPFDLVIYSIDWHPSDHISFYENLSLRPLHLSSLIPKREAKIYDTVIFGTIDGIVEQKLWPRHCVQNEWGSQLHEELIRQPQAKTVYKGNNSNIDSYSAFYDNLKGTQTSLNLYLKEAGITDIYVCGLAYDVCVGATAEDGLQAGYRTILISDCSRGTDIRGIERTDRLVQEAHGLVVESKQVPDIVMGKKRPFELAYFLAMKLKEE